MFEDDDFSDPDDFIALSSCEEKEYDSDKDPAWDPKMDTQLTSHVCIISYLHCYLLWLVKHPALIVIEICFC